MEYTVLTATTPNGELKTVLVYDLPNSANDLKDYFVPGTIDITSHGEVDITGDAENMVPETLEG